MEIQNQIILSTAYMPPLEYFYQIFNADKIYLEAFENFQKQSFRNRCQIQGPNGKQNLSVPVTKNGKIKMHTRDIEILYAEDWIKEHLSAIETAYSSSPFFIHYFDDLQKILSKKHSKLFDLNTELLHFFLKSLNIKKEISITEDYSHNYNNINDLRENIHPKKKTGFKMKNYFQVFNDRFDFMNNLSIIDGLFNLGPELSLYLESGNYSG